jgi:hypothetical protein
MHCFTITKLIKVGWTKQHVHGMSYLAGSKRVVCPPMGERKLISCSNPWWTHNALE